MHRHIRKEHNLNRAYPFFPSIHGKWATILAVVIIFLILSVEYRRHPELFVLYKHHITVFLFVLVLPCLAFLLYKWKDSLKSILLFYFATALSIAAIEKFVFQGSLDKAIFYGGIVLFCGLCTEWISRSKERRAAANYENEKKRYLYPKVHRAYRDSLDNLNIALLVLDHEGLIVSVNTVFLKFTRYQGAETLIGKPLQEHLAASHCSQFSHDFKKIQDSGGAMTIEVPLARADGSFVFIQMRIRPYDADVNNIYCCVVVDIDSEKKLETELTQYRQSFDFLVKIKTYKLTETVERLKEEITSKERVEKKLRKALVTMEAKAKAKNSQLVLAYRQLMHAEKLSAVGTFSAAIVHELGSPVFGIRNMLEMLLQKKVLTNKDNEMIRLSIDECGRIKKLLNTMQEFNRPTTSKMLPVNLNRVIDSVYLLSKITFNKKNIRLLLDFTDEDTMILAVEDQIKQVLLNLINNAAYVTPEKGGIIKVTTRRRGGKIVVQVIDSGLGIERGAMDHIFDPFFTTKPVCKGSGLGLSVSYSIIQKHKGSIHCENLPKQGAMFTVIFPCLE